MESRNAAIPPDRRIEFRIGINLGDVIVEGDDLYGDGVNVAARLEGIAEPGGVAVSAAVRDNVGNRLALKFSDLGEQVLKNIERPVRVYSVRPDEGESQASASSLSRDEAKSERLSIAVLPFTNMSGDPEQRYFSDGITEDIITELSRFRQLYVVARNSSFQFRGRDVDAIKAGRELGVQYLVEGSVRRLGERVRITAQLIDAANGNHLWAERFDRDQEDIFLVQDQVVRTIVATLVGRLQAAGAERAKRKPPASLAAYEYVLRADALPFYDNKACAEARALCEKAVEIDPGYARTYAFLAFLKWRDWNEDHSGSNRILDEALELAKKAVLLDDNDNNSHIALGETYLLLRSFELAEHHYRIAHDLNPNRPSVMAGLGSLYGFIGQPEKGLSLLKGARELDPYFGPAWYWHALGNAHFIARQYDEAIATFVRSRALPEWAHARLAACYALSDRDDEAKRHVAEVLRLAPDYSITREAAKEPFKQESDLQHLVDGLRKAGIPE